MSTLPERIKADIIDNTRDGITMQKILNSEIPHIKQFDVSTGYFDVKGYGLVHKALEQCMEDSLFTMRLLLGKEAVFPEKDSFEMYAQQYKEEFNNALSIKSSLEKDNFTSETRTYTMSLIKLLNRKTVEVRLGTNRFNHSKCYILGDNSVFIGSSNFTESGLTKNYELNAGLYQPGIAKQTREWFDRMWNSSNDIKQDLIDVLKQSKFGIPPQPFKVYMKMLFERYFPQIDEIKKDDDISTKDLAQFQKKAVGMALATISEYGGVMIADSTGLGKTNMGIAILRHKIYNERKRAILVSPAQVKDSMWIEKLKDADISVRHIITHDEIARYTRNDFAKFRNIDFVLVDESQGFRTKTAKRRNNLMTLLDTGKSKQIVLMSATPINNSLMDLYYQLLLITGEDEGYFSNSIGIPNLYKHMRDAASKDKQSGLEKIQQLIEAIIIRRTRTEIRDMYPDDEINGEKISFPQHKYTPIEYSLADMYPNIFTDMAEGSTQLTMAPYGVDYYNTNLSKKDQDKSRVTASLQKITLLKRFESSKEAVSISLDNKINMYKYVLTVLEQNKLPSVYEYNRIVRKWNNIDNNENFDSKYEVDEQEFDFIKEIEQVELVDAINYDLTSFKTDVRADLKILEDMREMVKEVKMDTKLDAVVRMILTDKALNCNDGKSGKVLIFTEYAATARYLLEKLGGTEKGNGKQAKRTSDGKLVRTDKGLLPSKTEIEIVTGDTSPRNRRERIRAFAPIANSTADEPFDGKEIDVLISTEVLAEGQNLQDCNYVVNYDLPWNPMRIVQRIGRIDRLTSRHNTIYSRACYPDKNLDDLLNLMSKLTRKIQTVDNTIGDDGSILGIPMTPRSTKGSHTERLIALSKPGDHSDMLFQMEQEGEMNPTTSLMNLINKYVKRLGINEMMSMPMGRRSGKRGDGQKAVLAYLQKQPHRHVHFVIYDYKTRRASVPDEAEAMRSIMCDSEEHAYLPMDSDHDNQKSFEELLVIDTAARAAIHDRNYRILEEKLRGDDISGQKRMKLRVELEKELLNALNHGTINEDIANRILDMMKNPRMIRRDNEINSLLLNYKKNKDIDMLVDEITHIADSLFLADRDEKQLNFETKSDNPALTLVGAMFITGDTFDSNLGKPISEMH